MDVVQRLGVYDTVTLAQVNEQARSDGGHLSLVS